MRIILWPLMTFLGRLSFRKGNKFSKNIKTVNIKLISSHIDNPSKYEYVESFFIRFLQSTMMLKRCPVIPNMHIIIPNKLIIRFSFESDELSESISSSITSLAVKLSIGELI
jgi:hypothetical protein